MATISVRVSLKEFRIRKGNDSGGKDEPYLLTLFAKLDDPLGNLAIPIANKVVDIHFPQTQGHGDLGAASKGMAVGGHVPVPAAIGDWQTVLNSATLDMSLLAMQNCSVGVGVVFLEEDSTLDSTIRTALPEVEQAVRRRANAFLRFVLGADPDLPANFPGRALLLEALAKYREQLRAQRLDVNGAIDGAGLMDQVLAAILPAEIGKAIGKVLIPGGGELWNLLAAGVQAADPDEFLASQGRMFTFFDLVGRAHEKTAFTMDTKRRLSLGVPTPPGFEPPTVVDTSLGLYELDGVARRTDCDEPPVLAAVRGPDETIGLFARRVDGDFFGRQVSKDFGKTFAIKFGGDFAKRVFRSGPAAASADGHLTWCVAGLGLDHKIWLALSSDAGGSWTAWRTIGQGRTFVGAPAVALSAHGTAVYVVARDDDHFYWFAASTDAGATWSNWRRIGAGTFRSSPALVRLSPRAQRPPLPDTLVVAGLGQDMRVWTSRFTATETLSGQEWQAIAAGPTDHPTGRFTSAPAMTSDGSQEIILVCRADDLRYWRVNSFDGGGTFMVGTTWQPHGQPSRGRVRYSDDGARSGDLQALYSAPALVASDDLETRVMFGLTPTLGLWRNRHTRHDNHAWRSIGSEPEIDLRVFFY